MAVIDVCSYNNERDLWDIHYNVLKDYVNSFIVIQFDKTFSGKERQVTWPEAGKYPKAKFYLHTEQEYEKYRELAESSPNTIGADHWKLEFVQKESIKDALTYLKDDDIVFIGDVDEVWDPILLKTPQYINLPKKLGLTVYTYYLNNRSSESFLGTLMSRYKHVKNRSLNHLRVRPPIYNRDFNGWHFTSMGGEGALRKKLTDSYTQESYATPLVLERLGDNIANDKDFLGRDFTYHVDESQWPQYLKDNKEKYQHLCK